MASDPTQHALAAMVQHLRDLLPARLTSADASRFAAVVCADGPYALTPALTVILNGTTHVLGITGAQTAAAIAADIGAAFAGITASADADGRLTFTSTVAPADDDPSVIKVGEGTANAALGLFADRSSSVRLAIGAPRPMILEHAIPVTLPVDRLTVSVEELSETGPTPIKGQVWPVSVGLAIVLPGALANDEADLEAVRAVVAEIKGAVRAGDGRGRNRVGGTVHGAGVVDCFSVRTLTTPSRVRGPKDRFYAVARESFRIRVYETAL